MKKLVQVAAALVLFSTLSPLAHAGKIHRDPANDKARALIQRMKAAKPKKPAMAATPLLNFSSSPSQGLQNQALSWIVQFDNPFTNRELSIEVKNNGQKVSAIQSPYKGMFLVSLGLQTEARANNTLEVTLFAEDPQTQTDTRNAVKLLDTDIRRLTNQINTTRDPAQRAILQGQREEKTALKNELLTQLKKYRWKLGTQSQAYSIIADQNSETLPKITSLLPVWGNVRGGTQVTISGVNFSQNATVLFGGLASPSVVYVNETTLQAITPDFEAAVGGKDVELRFTQNGVTKNVISPSAFFAANVADAVPTKPVAIASGSLRLDLGESALLDGTLSYSSNDSSIGYSWKVASAPASSNYTVGQVVGTASTATVTPSVHGTYVFSLVVKDLNTQDQLESDPSIVVIQVDGGPQPAANPITVASGASATSQVIANDPTPGEMISYMITQAPSFGIASISSLGLVTYQAPANQIGSTSIVVRVADQAGHFANITIPVTVVTYTHAPTPYAAPITSHSEIATTQVFANDPDAEETFSYEIIAGPSHGTASINGSGLVTYQPASGYVGSDSMTVRVTDSGVPPANGLAAIAITAGANSSPVVNAPNIVLGQSSASGTSQASITDDAGQTGTYSVSEPSNGTTSVNSSGLVTYTPGPSYAGSDSFVLSYTDNGIPGLTGTKTINVYTNDPPQASAPGISVTTGGTATSQITASDPNSGQAIGYMLSSAPEHGTAEVSSSGLVTYHSTGGYTGADSLIVTVFDNGTPQMSTPVEIQVTVNANNAPTGSAPSITVTGLTSGTSQITASANDPGETLSYAISTQPGNGTASVNSSGLVTFTPASSENSTGTIQVSVTDNGYPNLSVTISIPVNVNAPGNQAPVIPDGGGTNSLGFTLRSQGVPYMTTMGLGFGATQTINDPDGTIVSAVWNFGDGTSEKTPDFTLGSITHNYVAAGTYTATLTVTDNGGATASRQLEVVVVDTDIPTAKFTVSPSNGGGGVVPITITFDASASADSDGITQYRWRFGNSATSEVVTTNPVITRTFNSAGTNIPIRLRTRDANRAQGESTVAITVGSTVPGVAVQAQFQPGPPRQVTLGTAMNFDGSRSFNPNVGGTLIAYNWNFGDFLTCPGTSGGCTATGLTTSYTYPAVGHLSPFLRVQSSNGSFSGQFFQEVFIVNEGHAPRAIGTAAPAGSALTVSFSGSESYDYDGTIANYTWFFGDGSTPVCNPTCDNTGENVTHTFPAANSYVVRLTVTDDDGNMTNTNFNVSVNAFGQIMKPKRTMPYDPDREYQRQLLAGGCFEGSGEACSGLADMYDEDGDAFTAGNLRTKACQLGYQPACPRIRK